MTCNPGNDCCQDCKDHAPTERVLVQAGRGLNAGTAFLFLQQANNEVVTWGPASTEAVSEDAKLVRMQAVEESLPAAFELGTATILHKDQNVGRFHPLIKIEPGKVPPGPARELAEYLQQAYGGAPTGVLEVTPPLVKAFPKQLTPHLGKRAFFFGTVVPGNTETRRLVQQAILRGELDAYSISSRVTRSQPRVVCDDDSCKEVEEVLGMDLSAVTYGSSREGGGWLAPKVRNPGAAFLVLQQARVETPKTMTPGVRSMAVEGDAPAEAKGEEQAGGATQTTAVTGAPSQPADLIEQADEAVPGVAAPSTQDQLMSDVMRRLEALEQRVAAMPMAKEETMEQAKPAIIDPAALEQAAVTAAVKAAETRFKTLLEQSRPADTPNPASPADPTKTREAALMEAARSGDPTRLLAALDGLKTHGEGGKTA